jgi:hypothetical protein
MKTLLLQIINKERGEIQEEAWSAYMGMCRHSWWNNEKIKIKKIKIEDLKHDHLKSIPIGGVSFVKKYLDLHQIKIPQITYDHSYFINKIKTVTFQDLKTLKYPLFVKPMKLKSLNGEVYDSYHQMLDNVQNMNMNIEDKFYVNENIYDFECEHRIYVHNKKVKNVCKYQGEVWCSQPNKNIVETFVNECEYKTYSFDVGFDKISQTWIPIEINDFWSLGNYGIRHEDYYLAIRDRWEEIIK